MPIVEFILITRLGLGAERLPKDWLQPVAFSGAMTALSESRNWKLFFERQLTAGP